MPEFMNRLVEIFPEVGEPDDTTATCFQRSYALLIIPRSGSTFLSRTLLASGLFGDPDEWFNDDLDSVAANFVKEGRGTTFYSYIAHVHETRTGANGVFGVQLSVEQLHALNTLVPLPHVVGPRACWFFLRRRNLVAQAISDYKANTTGRFHSYQDAQAEATYDPDALAAKARHIVALEQEAFTFFGEQGLWPIELYYEDIVDEGFTMAFFRNALQIYGEAGTDTTIRPTYPVEKLATPENARWEKSFRSDRRRVLAEIERERPRILVPFPSPGGGATSGGTVRRRLAGFLGKPA